MIFMNINCRDFSRCKDFYNSNLSCSNHLINFFEILIEVRSCSLNLLIRNYMSMIDFGWYLLYSFSSRFLYPNRQFILAFFFKLSLSPRKYCFLSKLLKKIMTYTVFFQVYLSNKVFLFIHFLTILI